LRKATSDAIGRIEAAGRVAGAINWADLDCIEAARIETDEEYTYFRVVISEASPDADKFQRAVRADLHEHGFPCIEVVTEW